MPEQVEKVDHVACPGCQTLDKYVGEVEVGCFRQVLREQVLDRERILQDLGEGGRRSRGEGCDQKYLDDLERKVAVLYVELD